MKLKTILTILALSVALTGCEEMGYHTNKAEADHRHSLELKKLELEFKRLEFEREKFPFLVKLCEESLKIGKGTNCSFGNAR